MNCLGNLAAIEMLAGNYAAARRTYEEVLPLTHALGYRWAEGTQLIELGSTVRLLGEYGLARELFERGRMLMQEVGDEHNEIFVLAELGRLDSYLGAFDRAQSWLDECNRFIDASKSYQTYEEYWLARAVLALQQDEYDKALTAATRAWELLGVVKSRSAQAEALVLIGHAQAGLQQSPPAFAAYTQSVALLTAVGKAAQAVEASAGLAAIALGQGDRALALQQVEELLPVLAESPTAGVDEPFRVYLTCYRVLAANHDPRAIILLQRGHDLLQQYASQIQDHALRCSFLENVVIHRDLVAAYHECQARHGQ
jgi:tetratricopeptide (TPR) repeat protein